MREGRGYAPGKVILLGEHSVVYGRPALAAALDLGVRVEVGRVVSTRQKTERGVPRHFSISAVADERVEKAVEVAVAEYDLDRDGIDIAVESDLPISVGLGSSAAFSVALVRALAVAHGIELGDAAVSARAFALEKVFHGFPSGIDNTVASFGGVLRFRHGEEPQRLPVARPLSMVICVGREPRQTSAAVRGVRERRNAEPQRYEALFDMIARLVESAEQSIERGDVDALAEAMAENQKRLEELGVSTAELEEMIRSGRRAGARAGKLTGGGGGGAVILLCDEAEQAARVARHCGDAGWHAFACRIGDGEGHGKGRARARA